MNAAFADAIPQYGRGTATDSTRSGVTDVDALISGRQWATKALTYAFPASTAQYDASVYYSYDDETTDFAAASPGLSAIVTGVMGQWARISGLTIAQTTDFASATMLIGRTGMAATAYAYLPETGPGKGGDIWFGFDRSFDVGRRGDYGWATALHEIGHALGLKHAHTFIGGAGPYADDIGVIAAPVSAARDSLEYSIMSYRSHVGQDLAAVDHYTNETFGFPQTPMMLDIAALQQMYGADFSTNAGDTVYSFSSATGEMFVNGAGEGAPGANRVFLTIWDGGGTDTYDLSNYAANQSIDLRPGSASLFSARQQVDLGEGFRASGNIYNALLNQNDQRSLIENAIAGAGGDTLIGNAANNRLDGGAGRDHLTGGEGDDLLLGGEALAFSMAQGSVIRLYDATLDRLPDASGFADWSQRLDRGDPLVSIAAGFVESQEFQQVYGSLTGAEFVTLLYNNVLERQPDQAGLADWVGRLSDGASRASVVVGFSESAEFRGSMDFASIAYMTSGPGSARIGQVYRLYDSTFDRQPDPEGFQTWVSRLDEGSTLAAVTSGFINSAEFRHVYGALDNSRFVTLLYNNVLDRTPDQGGLNTWVGALTAGMSRESVLLGFSESEEHTALMAPGLDAFLENVATAWNDTIEGGAGSNVVFGGRGADDFVFHAGHDGVTRIFGFDAWDQLRFDAFGYGGAGDALSHMSQTGRHVTFSDQGVSIVFQDTSLAAFAGESWFA